jgi:ferredoxin-NADP reductase
MTNNVWQIATLKEKKKVAENVLSMVFKLPKIENFKSGQHFDFRLTAPSGYVAERSYSIANVDNNDGEVEFGIELLKDGEVSPFLWQLNPGRQLEMRGPIGGHFIWDSSMPGPLILVAVGSGMVPLMSMLRDHVLKEANSDRKIVLLLSVKTPHELLYADELKTLMEKNTSINFFPIFTRETPEGWTGYNRRIDKKILEETILPVKDQMPMTYICGPTAFVETVANELVNLGFNPHTIKTERFG